MEKYRLQMSPVSDPAPNRGPWRPFVSLVGISLVVVTAVANMLLVGRTILNASTGGGDDPSTYLGSTIFLLVATLIPVAGMLYVSLIPTPTPFGQWTVLIGSGIFLVLDLVLVRPILESESSTAALGFLISVPVLLFYVVLLAVPIAVSNDRAQSRKRASAVP